MFKKRKKKRNTRNTKDTYVRLWSMYLLHVESSQISISTFYLRILNWRVCIFKCLNVSWMVVAAWMWTLIDSAERWNVDFELQTAGVPRAWATHGGEDVPVFAIGPLASVLFSGSVDQSYIPHAISYASCLGHYASRCSRDSSSSNDTMSAPISCPSAEPNSAAISSDVMNDQARNPPTKSAASLEPVGSRSLPTCCILLPLLLAVLPCPPLRGTS